MDFNKIQILTYTVSISEITGVVFDIRIRLLYGRLGSWQKKWLILQQGSQILTSTPSSLVMHVGAVTERCWLTTQVSLTVTGHSF